MKKVILFLIVSLLLCPMMVNASDLFVEGFVGKDYFQKGNNPDNTKEMEYRVLVTLENRGEEITYEEAVAIFMPMFGNPLTISMEMEEAIIIAKGEKKSIVLRTEGYTEDLMATAGNGPLMLFVFLQKEKKNISGLFATKLPNIKKVPHIKGEKEKEKILPLDFVEIEKDLLKTPSFSKDKEAERDEVPTVSQSRIQAL